jgi:hypothetical protein
MNLSSLLSSFRRRLTAPDPEVCHFRETVLVASIERRLLDEALAAMEWNYAELVKGKALYDAYGSQPPLVVTGSGDRAVVFSAPTGLRSDIYYEQMRDCVGAMQEAAVPYSDATFVLSFGAGHEMSLVEVISMTGDRDETRPALALALTEWAGEQPRSLATFKTLGTAWRPQFGLSYRTFGKGVCLHACAADMDSAASLVDNDAVALVQGEYGRLIPLGDHPANTVVLNLADGCAYDMLGGMAVPLNIIARSSPAAFV